MADSSNTRLDLDAIEERANAATTGPWDVSWKYGDQKTERYCILGPKQFADPIAATSRLKQGSVDAEFIAAARSDVPSLVAEVRASASECEKLKAALADSEAERPAVERLVAALRGLLEGIDRVEPILSGITTHHQLRTGTRYTPDEISCESEIAAARAVLAEFGQQPTGDGQ